MEALALTEAGDGAGGVISGGNAGDGFEVLSDDLEIDLGPKSTEAGLFDLNAGFEEALLETEDDEAGVDELRTLDARHDADDGVIKGVRRGHGWPPGRSGTTR